jgi:hypothetical protein
MVVALLIWVEWVTKISRTVDLFFDYKLKSPACFGIAGFFLVQRRRDNLKMWEFENLKMSISVYFIFKFSNCHIFKLFPYI